MSLSMSFTVTPDGGDSYEVVASPRDILRWEQDNKSKGASLMRLAEQARLEDFYGIAYKAVKRQGLFTGTLAEFMETADVEPGDDDESPTQEAV